VETLKLKVSDSLLCELMQNKQNDLKLSAKNAISENIDFKYHTQNT
jgi:hypothetical protein